MGGHGGTLKGRKILQLYSLVNPRDLRMVNWQAHSAHSLVWSRERIDREERENKEGCIACIGLFLVIMIIIPYCILIHQAVFYNELLRQYTIEYRVLVKRCEPYIKVKYADLYKTKSKELMKYYQEFLDTCNKNPTFNSTIHGNMSLPGYSSK